MLLKGYGLGYVGAAIACSLTQWFLALIMVFFIWRGNYHVQTWPTDTTTAELFQGWLAMLRMGIPGTIMIMAEWCCFEAIALWVGLLGELQLKSYMVALNVCASIFMVSLSLGVTVSSLVGNLLGAGDAKVR